MAEEEEEEDTLDQEGAMLEAGGEDTVEKLLKLLMRVS